MDAFSPGKNPFFEHGQAQFFIACRDGVDVGRISAQVDSLEREADLGFFGAIVAVEDRAVVEALLDAAERWLIARGKARMRGPFTLSINEESGLLVDGFDTPPVIFMPYNPPYLAQLIESCGLVKAKDLLAYRYDLVRDIPRSARRLIDRQKRSGLRVRFLDTKNIQSEFRLMNALFNDAWQNNWGFIPFTAAEFQHLGKGLKPLLHPDLVAVVEMNGQAVGFGIVLPNLNEVIRDFNGRLAPFNWLKLLWRLRRGTKTGRVPLMGVDRKYAGALSGGAVPYFIIDSLRTQSLRRGMREMELSWVLEDNDAVRNIARGLNAFPYKTYRIYEKTLDASPGAASHL